jgi:hypothetical protein
MQQKTVRGPRRRDTGWKRDGKKKGIYWRRRADGSKSWGYYAWGKINAALSREAAIDAQAKARLDKSAGRPAPNPHVLVRDLAEEVREAKKLKLRASSFQGFQYALDKVLLPELGHLRLAGNARPCGAADPRPPEQRAQPDVDPPVPDPALSDHAPRDPARPRRREPALSARGRREADRRRGARALRLVA